MKIVSFDIGIYNLAAIIVEQIDDKICIKDWFLFDITKESDDECNKMKHYCCNINSKNNKKCASLGKFINNNNYYCKRHRPVEGSIELNPVKKNKKDKYDLCKVNNCMIRKMDKRPELLDADYILIENQPSLKNPKIKTIQMMVFSYFSIRYHDNNKYPNIMMVSPSNKLREFKDQITETAKSKRYTQTKKLSITLTKDMISSNYSDFFENHYKKDDLADCLLQARWYIKNKLKKEIDKFY